MIKIELSTDLYHSNSPTLRVRQHMGSVLLGIDEKVIQLKTPTAHKVGFSLVKKSSEAFESEHIKLIINNESIPLLPIQARQLGGAILKKTMQADDYQTGGIQS